MEIVFPADQKVYDGRYANNAWLQELPDPITKLTWDKCCSFEQVDCESAAGGGSRRRGNQCWRSKATGGSDDRTRARRLFAQPFARLGYGRWAVGKVGRRTGFNAYKLRKTDAPYYATRVTVKLIQKNGYKLVQTQNHYSMEGRALVREGTLEDYNKNPEFAKESMDGC
jgi:hypothetical protein